MSDSEFDFKSNKTTFPFLKKKSGKHSVKHIASIPKQKFLKKSEGKLASQYHGHTVFSQKRKDSVIKNQIDTENKMIEDNYVLNQLKIDIISKNK
jgi:hypothetical protein